MSWLKRLGLLSAVLAVGAVALIVGLRSYKTDQSGASVTTSRRVAEANPASKTGQNQVKAGAKSAAKKGFVLQRTGAAAKADDGKNKALVSAPSHMLSPSEAIAAAGLPVPGDSNKSEKPWSKKDSMWPDPRRGTAEGVIIGYRTTVLPPRTKSGACGERHEWLIEPTEGYTCHAEEDYYQGEKGELQFAGGRQYVANQVMLSIPAEVSLAEFRSEMRKSGAIVKDPLMELEKGAQLLTVMIPEVSFGAVAGLTETIRRFDANLRPEMDFIHTVGRTPNDPRYSSLWGMPKIHAPDAWNTRTDASSVLVAVVDTGIKYTHEDLAANMWHDPSLNSGSSYYYGKGFIGGSACSPLDDNGHGSHCAGTIAGVGNNSKGVAGVAWSAKLMACKFLSSSGSGATSDAIQCINYAREKGAKILSCSWGGGGYDSTLNTVINTLRSSGIIMVCAAGNDGTNNDSSPHYPSSYSQDNIVAVASVGTTDALSTFSCYGASSVDIAAPGESIFSTYYSADNSYATLSGTSMATPHVSGALALIWAQYPSDGYLAVIRRLYNAGDTVTALNGKCSTGKRLNVGNAFASTGALPAPTVTASNGTYADQVVVSWSAISDATHYQLFRATTDSSASATSIMAWSGSTSYTDTSVSQGTTYYYFVKAAASSSGSRASNFSASARGFAQQDLRDAWDHGDDTSSGSTVLDMSVAEAVHGPHSLATADQYDWFKVSLVRGNTYCFESITNSSSTGTDTYAELYRDPAGSRIAYNDDGGESLNFRLTYTPSESGDYYLRVRAYSVGSIGHYSLRYTRSTTGDEWDPGDDTRTDTSTTLTPTTADQTHGPHTLSAIADSEDWFKVSLRTDRAYTFYSALESGDPVGELYDSDGSRVAYNDDGGNMGLNFRLTYRPTTAGDYYLKVRTCGSPADARYTLHYSYEDVQNVYELAPARYTTGNWPDSLFVTKSLANMRAETEFATTDTVYVCYGWVDRSGKVVVEPVTNSLRLVNSSGTETWWALNWWPNGLSSANEIGRSSIQMCNPGRGSYTLTLDVNQDRNGNHTVRESDYSNNRAQITFTVVNPAPVLNSIRIDGNTRVASEGTAQYRCVGTYSDGTVQDVTPHWDLDANGTQATISDGGLLSAGLLDPDSTSASVTLSATYGGKTSNTLAIEIYRDSSAIEPEPPFPQPVVNPTAPWIVEAPVRINGSPAESGDVVAAFVGSECRGIGGVGEDGMVYMPVYLNGDDEQLTFQVWDRTAGDEGTVYNVMQTVSRTMVRRLTQGYDGYGWTPETMPPAELDACAQDPFGTPVIRPGTPMLMWATATINDNPASAGDVLAVYDGQTLLGKQVLRYRSTGQSGDGEAYCMMVMYPGNVSVTGLTFRVWDVSEDVICRNRKSFHLNESDYDDGFVGSPDRYVNIPTTDDKIVEVIINHDGWNMVSFSVVPSNPSPAEVFAPVSDKIRSVVGGNFAGDPPVSMWAPQIAGSSTLYNIALGCGYYVNVQPNQAPLYWEVEGAGDVNTDIPLNMGWNLVGYTLPRGGRVRDVLKTAVNAGWIDQVIQDTAIWPNGNLTTMDSGIGYWVHATRQCTVRFDALGMMSLSACAAAREVQEDCGPFGKLGEFETDFGDTPSLDKATELANITVNLFGKPAQPGDCVAVYGTGENANKCYAKAKIVGDVTEDNSGSNTVSLLVYAEDTTVLRFKVWNHLAGLDAGVYESPTTFTVADNRQPSDGKKGMVTGLVADTDPAQAPTFTVTFDLDGKGEVGEGGTLVQQIRFGEGAQEPTVVPYEGLTFSFWEFVTPEGANSFTDVRSDMRIKAYYDGELKNKVTVTFDPNGGEGEMKPQEFVQNVTQKLATCEFTYKGSKFLGWATSVRGDVEYEDGQEVAFEKDETLYAVWEGIAPKTPVLIANPTEGAVKDSTSYSGWLKGADGVMATFTVKISKAKNGSAKATMTIQPVGGKKQTLKGSIDMTTGEGKEGLVGLKFGEKGVSLVAGATIAGASALVGARDAGKKGDEVLAALDTFDKKVYSLVISTKEKTSDRAMVSLTFSKKGKTKAAVTFADGTKATVTCKASKGDTLVAVPVANPKAKAPFSFVVWINASTFALADVTDLPKDWAVLAKGNGAQSLQSVGNHVLSVDVNAVKALSVFATLPVYEALLPTKTEGKFDGKKYDFGKACKVAKDGTIPAGGVNPANVKVTVKAKDGSLKGSFTIYSNNAGKLKKTKVSLNGLVIDGVGYMNGLIKKVGCFMVDVSK